MNLKVVFLLCLVFFAATLVTNIANTVMVTLTTMKSGIGATSHLILDTSPIEPMGDPVDDPVAPN